MKSGGILYWLLLIIAVVTLISGVVQLVDPSFVLQIVAAEQTATTRHFFGIVGMFMALFGGMLTHALLRAEDPSIVLLWAGLQKLGASAAVGLGVLNHIFSSMALLIASFDLLSGVLIFVYLRNVTRWKTSNGR
jgi:hypothetical protein